MWSSSSQDYEQPLREEAQFVAESDDWRISPINNGMMRNRGRGGGAGGERGESGRGERVTNEEGRAADTQGAFDCSTPRPSQPQLQQPFARVPSTPAYSGGGGGRRPTGGKLVTTPAALPVGGGRGKNMSPGNNGTIEEQMRNVDRVIKECDASRKQLENISRRLDDLHDVI